MEERMEGVGLFDLVVVPVDGSDYSIAALKKAIQGVSEYGGRLVILHVVDRDLVDEMMRFENKDRDEVKESLERNGRRYLAFARELADKAGVAAEVILVSGVPYEEIVKVADERDASLIVMGRLGRRGPRRILIGTVTERVIEYARCPVLVVAQEETTWKR